MGDACFEELPTDDAAAQPVADRGRLVSVPEPPPRRESDDLRAAEELRARLKWFLLGRVAVISGFLAMVTVAYLGSARERFDVPVNDLLLVVAAAYAFSALSAILLPHLQRAAAFGAQEPPVEARPANGNGHGSPVRSCDAERSGAPSVSNLGGDKEADDAASTCSAASASAARMSERSTLPPNPITVFGPQYQEET